MQKMVSSQTCDAQTQCYGKNNSRVPPPLRIPPNGIACKQKVPKCVSLWEPSALMGQLDKVVSSLGEI